MTNEDYDRLYEKIAGNNTYFDIEKGIDAIKEKDTAFAMRRRLCNELLYAISTGFTVYDLKTISQNPLVQIYIRQAHALNEKGYFESVAELFLGKNTLCLKYLENDLTEILSSSDKNEFTEDAFIDYYFEPFKNAFKGFWTRLGELLNKNNVQNGLTELCYLLEDFYSYASQEECIERLIPFSQDYPELILPKELLANSYYCLHMWRNAIAYYHIIEDKALFFPTAMIYFDLAWSYSKIKDYRQEEHYYRKCMELTPKADFVRNNLGYCLIRQKKYSDALPLFEECLQENADLPYAANNYVRTLIALGRNKDAKVFADSGKYKISKDILERVKKLSNKNEKPVAEISQLDYKEEESEPSIKEAKTDFAQKKEQFSNEKILEDELTARIESGREVFGLKLHVYNHKGDYYGRQYPLPHGRLDLLCEDENGDLLIIELKKDSGYDDVYKQTTEYLDYFEKNKIGKGKKVSGIICLNNPSHKLVKQVKDDSRLRLFEYQISFREV